jgi:hypothetical protein
VTQVTPQAPAHPCLLHLHLERQTMGLEANKRDTLFGQKHKWISFFSINITLKLASASFHVL